MATTFLAGAAFGVALTASGVSHPSTIVNQFALEDWHMLQTFLTAAGCSTLICSAFQEVKYAEMRPRGYSTLGLFASYDGNLIGGAMLGVGMALAGSCPGTLLAQLGVGTPSSIPALCGAITAGVVWSGYSRPWLQSSVLSAKFTVKESPITIDKWLGLEKAKTMAIYEVVIAALVASLVFWTEPGHASKIVSPVAGGLLIGAAQIVTILLRRTGLGSSAVYEVIGDMFWGLLRSSHRGRLEIGSVVFAVGIVAGAWALAIAAPIGDNLPNITISTPRSTIGGFLMIFGARMAGGCTSGHGITGTSLLSVSSFMTIGMAMLAGLVTSNLLPSTL